MTIVISVAEERVARFRAKVGHGETPIVADPCAQLAAEYGVAEQIYGVLEWVNRPACFVVGRNGLLRWSYVGRELVDRPSLAEVLSHVEDP